MAARWNGQAPQIATGEARANESHCQLRNCSAGIIASTTTGTVRTVETSKRCRSDANACASACSAGSAGPATPAPAPSAGSACGGGGSCAV